MSAASQRPDDARPASDEEAARDARRRRREAARRHHPDLGGDPEAFIAALRALETEAPLGGPSAPETPGAAAVVVTVTTSVRSRTSRVVRRRTARLVRAAQHRLPRSVPGSRRYRDL